MLGEARIGLMLVILFIASFTIFYIFGSINSLSDKCQAAALDICKQFTGLSGMMIVVLLLVGAFVMIMASTLYLWVSSR